MAPKNVEFVDPHPGLMGCTIRIPENVKVVADSLNGTKATLTDAMERLQQSLPIGEFKLYDDWIGLTVKVGGLIHSWRVIRFREIE